MGVEHPPKDLQLLDYKGVAVHFVHMLVLPVISGYVPVESLFCSKVHLAILPVIFAMLKFRISMQIAQISSSWSCSTSPCPQTLQYGPIIVPSWGVCPESNRNIVVHIHTLYH